MPLTPNERLLASLWEHLGPDVPDRADQAERVFENARRDETPSLPSNLLDAAVNPALPPGVIEFRYPNGLRYRFPLVEFTDD